TANGDRYPSEMDAQQVQDQVNRNVDWKNRHDVATVVFMILGFIVLIGGIGIAQWWPDLAGIAGALLGLASALMSISIGFATGTRPFGGIALFITFVVAMGTLILSISWPAYESNGLVAAGIGTGFATLALLLDLSNESFPWLRKVMPPVP